MDDFFKEALSVEGVSPRHFAEVLLRLLATAVLAALIAYRPWRRLFGRPPIAAETAQAQTLIAVSGALMIAVIGDSTARAFGLVGLGGFIRFRSGIKDPRDAAVMFVMIGIGMACGRGLMPMAVVATAFAVLMLMIFDGTSRTRPRKARLAVDCEDPVGAMPLVRGHFPGARVIAAPQIPGDKQRIVLELTTGEDVDAAAILEQLVAKGVPGIKNVTLEED